MSDDILKAYSKPSIIDEAVYTMAFVTQGYPPLWVSRNPSAAQEAWAMRFRALEKKINGARATEEMLKGQAFGL